MAFNPVYEILNPLVGTPEATQDFEMLLKRLVRGDIPVDEAMRLENATENGYYDAEDGIDPDKYHRLETGLKTILDLQALGQSDIDPQDKTSEQLEREQALLTTSMFSHEGVEFATLAVLAVGDTYKENAVVPQWREGVLASVSSALAYLVHIALMDESMATRDLRAISRGEDPNYVEVQRKYALPTPGRARVETLIPAFVAIEDGDEGQLKVRPRFPLFDRNPDKHCPAVDMRVARPDGQVHRTVSALWEFVSVIARVAVDEIYPDEFPIVSELC